MVELLAPAGSKEAFIAAIEAGADAIYLAGNRFGARAYADNFDKEDLLWAFRFAHLRGVRVHVTVNTVAADEELPDLARYLRFLYEAGADAILVQDLGVARLAHEIVPDLPLHASTQMTIHNLAGVKAMEELGFSRVVLSRELSLQEIQQICRHSKIEIEVFLHGALCVCYSGQCLMSSMIGGRSGNRGCCAQPCRMQYSLIDSQGKDVLGDQAGKYLLSPKDLNTIDILPDLIRTGVTSLKIEGRMKRPEYVAVVVHTYRQAIDCLSSGNPYKVDEDAHDALRQIFNRDFTTAYLEAHQGKRMMSDRRPNNRGLSVGRVVRYDRDHHRVLVKLSGRLELGDQVDFWVKVGGRVAATVTQLTDSQGRAIGRGTSGEMVSFPLSSVVHAHDRVFKVYDAHLMQMAKNFYTSGAPVRRVPVDICASASVGKPLRLRMKDADGFQAETETSFIGILAEKRPLDASVLRKQINRLGTSIFSLRNLKTELDGKVMIPLSEINEARRRAVEMLEQQRLALFLRSKAPQKKITFPKNEDHSEKRTQLIVETDSLESAKSAFKAGADEVLFGGDSYHHRVLGITDYEAVLHLAEQQGKRISFNTPRILKERDIPEIVRLWKHFASHGPSSLYVQNIGTWKLAREETNFPLRTDTSLISFNHSTLAFWKDKGAASVTLSPELTLQQVRQLGMESPLPLETVVYGVLELMVSEYCTLGSYLGGLGEKEKCSMPCLRGRYSLRDRKNIDFPIVTDQYCHMHIMNSRPLSMLPQVNAFKTYGISRVRMLTKDLSSEQVYRVVRLYRSAMDGKLSAEEAEEIERREIAPFTRGHYFRGVLNPPSRGEYFQSRMEK